MADWRQGILKHFKKDIRRLTLVSDPDGLLTEEQMLTEIKRRGFDLIPFDDSIAFRYAYESKYRSIWDRGQKTELVVVLRSESELHQLPYDLLKSGRQLEFSLHKLFPNLSHPVLAALDRSLLDRLFAAYEQDHDSQLASKATKDFVLRSCFRVERSMITGPVDFLRAMLPLYYANRTLPRLLAEHLTEHLQAKPAFAGWPFAEIFASHSAFLQFLQCQWKFLVDQTTGGSGSHASTVHESPGTYSESPATELLLVPFEHQDVWAYVDTFFLEGLLTPIECESVDGFPSWALVGVQHDPAAESLKRFAKLVEHTSAKLPAVTDTHREWQRFARAWAESVVLRWELDTSLDEASKAEWSDLHVDVEERFAEWMLERFGSLYNLPSIPQPVMVHHVPQYLSSVKNHEEIRKLALVIMDGLALDQWLILRKVIEERQINWRMEEFSVFAWVPSLTSISRQSIFSGQPPMYFADSLEHTSREPKHWSRFWENQGIAADLVHYAKEVKTGDSAHLDECLVSPHESVVGIVVNTVDEIMHGEKQGSAGMHDAIRLEADNLISVLARLIDEGYEVFLTADHGNISAVGVGKLSDGVLVETTGKRVRIYPNEEFRANAKQEVPQSVEWSNVGLPPECFALFPADLSAFTFKEKSVVSHGGIALEEVIVPFVRFHKEEG